METPISPVETPVEPISNIKPVPNNDSKNSSTQPIEYIYEAELLLAYVAQNGLEIDDAIVSVIVNSKYWLEHGEWTPEREIQFWVAFNTIAKRVSPVSVASLKATSSTVVERSLLREQRRRFNFYLSPKGSTFAKQSVSVYQKSTVWVLIILLLTHSYWLLQSMFIAPLFELRQQIEQTKRDLTSAKQNPAITRDTNEDPRINDLESKLKEYDNSYQVYSKMIRTCNPLFSLFAACLISKEQPKDKPNQPSTAAPERVIELEPLLQQKKFILTSLQLFVLPLLYGLLGAFVYVLRTLTVEIKTLTYTKESNISYRLRIQLGALAGLAIGWFTGPNASFSLDAVSSEALSTLGGVSAQTLSPMALAFLAGYSVDVLFALMDRIIYAFSSKEITPPNVFKPSLTTNKVATDK
ncbi:MAG: hypothetical protein HC877_10210 [Thioploca sp.]|nr:hypothetical protein [Thioploca sp.]